MDNAGIVCLMSMSPLIFSKIQDEKNKSEGTQNNPFNLTDLGVSLSDFKILTMLLTDDDHKKVLSLTDEDV